MFATGLPTRLFKSLALWLALPLRIALFLLCFTPVATYASQLTFNKTVTPDDIQFKYRWLDNEGTEQTIAFSLPKAPVSTALLSQSPLFCISNPNGGAKPEPLLATLSSRES